MIKLFFLFPFLNFHEIIDVVQEKYQNKYRIPSARLGSATYKGNGIYFVTICTAEKRYYFGNISDEGTVSLSDIGLFAQRCWMAIPQHFPFVRLGEFVVMPNHIHGLLIFRRNDPDIKDMVPNKKFQNQKQNLGAIIGSFKSVITKYAKQNGIAFGWQERYYDHIVRKTESYSQIKNYILGNPRRWAKTR